MSSQVIVWRSPIVYGTAKVNRLCGKVDDLEDVGDQVEDLDSGIFGGERPTGAGIFVRSSEARPDPLRRLRLLFTPFCQSPPKGRQ